MITYALSCLFAVALVALLLVVAWVLWTLVERAIVRAAAYPDPPAGHLRAVSPDPCRSCRRVGLHDAGCSYLDRLDRGGVA